MAPSLPSVNRVAQGSETLVMQSHETRLSRLHRQFHLHTPETARSSPVSAAEATSPMSAGKIQGVTDCQYFPSIVRPRRPDSKGVEFPRVGEPRPRLSTPRTR